MNKSHLICIIGIDGSGKTTQAKLLEKNLVSHGVNCKYTYGRIIPVLPRPFMYIGKKLFLKNSDNFKNFNDHTTKKKSLFKNQFLALLYTDVFLFDYVIQALIKIKIPLLLGMSIVSDRYIYDTVVTDLSVDLNYTDEKIQNMINMLMKILPKPDIVFYIDIPETVAMSRKNDVPSIDYLIERRKKYLTITGSYNMDIVDGEKSMSAIGRYLMDKSLTIYGLGSH